MAETDVEYQHWNGVTGKWEADQAIGEVLVDYFNLKVKLQPLYDAWSATDKHFKATAMVHQGIRCVCVKGLGAKIVLELKVSFHFS